MSSLSSMNKNNSAVKRIMQEARELANDPCTDYSAAPLEDDIFEWHCTLRGPAGTEFEGGLYHFRIMLPAEYPFRPPSLMMLTPNGRFELNTKICISFTSYHEELWQPAWGVRTAIIGLQGFFPLKGQAAVGVGSIEYPATERRRLADLSRHWTCPHCKQSNLELLPDPDAANTVSEIPTPALSQDVSPPLPAHSSDSQPSIELRNNSGMSEVIPTAIESQPVPQTTNSRLDSPASVTLETIPATRGPTLPRGQAVTTTSRPTTHRVPLLLDTAICVLLVLVCALIFRRLY